MYHLRKSGRVGERKRMVGRKTSKMEGEPCMYNVLVPPGEK